MNTKMLPLLIMATLGKGWGGSHMPLFSELSCWIYRITNGRRVIHFDQIGWFSRTFNAFEFESGTEKLLIEPVVWAGYITRRSTLSKPSLWLKNMFSSEKTNPLLIVITIRYLSKWVICIWIQIQFH